MILEEKLARGDFVVTAEIVPPLSGSADDLLKRAAPLGGVVDAVNVTDGAGARLAMSSLAASALLVREGLEPVWQITCRDRNRIGLASDILGASALGIKNVLVLNGDDPAKGDMPEAKPVFDVDSRALIAMAADLQGPGGREIVNPPRLFTGCADAPFDVPADWQPKGLEAKIAAGARFAQTQFCFDIEVTRRYFARLTEMGITDKLKFIAGIGPLLSLKQARFMNDNLFGVTIPHAIMARMENASNEKSEGRAICRELVAQLREIDGISGVHIMAPMQSGTAIAEVVKGFSE